MYYSTYQNLNSNATVSTRPHTSKKTYRKFAIRMAMMVVIMLIAVSIGAIVQVNAESNTTRTSVPINEAVTNYANLLITVEQGDTLWSIAQAHTPKGTNVREYIDKLKKTNHLTNSKLQAGQQLYLPT